MTFYTFNFEVCWNRKLRTIRAVLIFFQQKYGMDFDEFRQRVVDKSDGMLASFGSIEKENDDNDWDDAIDFLADYTTYLYQIRP